jgi:hypothetical protein
VDCWAPCFYFYKGGVAEAVRVLLSTYQYSITDRDYYCNPVTHDYDLYLESVSKNNALPLNYSDLWRKLELATKQIDQAISLELNQYLGDHVVTITDVQFIGNGTSVILVAER